MDVLPTTGKVTRQNWADYRRILALIRKLGIKEPLLVYAQRPRGKFIHDDGASVWRERRSDYLCLMATDDREIDYEVWRNGKCLWPKAKKS